MEAGGALSDEQAARLAAARADLKYVLHFPKGEKYVSLLKDADTPEAQVRTREVYSVVSVVSKIQLYVDLEAEDGRILYECEVNVKKVEASRA